MRTKVICVIAATIFLCASAFAMFRGDPRVPVDRLITNTTAYIKEHPDDAMGPYTLARIHYLAMATGSSSVLGFDGSDGRLPSVNEPDGASLSSNSGQQSRGGTPSREKAWTEQQLRDHLERAVENFQKALKMDPKNGLFHLGLASLSHTALNTGLNLGPIPGTEASQVPKDGNFTPLWREQAIAEYLKAHELTTGTNTTVQFGHIASGMMSVPASKEAAQGYVTLVTERGVRDEERVTFEKVKAFSEDKKNSVVWMAITPIIFRLSGAVPLEEMLDAAKSVAFDLDGTGRAQRYSWLRPDTGILVWDPLNEGRIVSGHQLFGSVTFRMFWPDGYRALDVLDDNRDGELRDGELQGLAVWFDRNQNGVSDSDEVIPIERTGIAAISARAATRVGDSPANETGLVMKDGRHLPTYDWTTKPLPAPRS